MKNRIKQIMLMSALALLLLLSSIFLASCNDDTKSEYDWTNFPKDMANNGLLLEQVVNNLDVFSEEKDSSGNPFYYWRQNDNSDEVIQKIELIVKDGKPSYYHYKNYTFDIEYPSKQISISDAEELINEFVSLYFDKEEKLSFERAEGAQSLYDPGHVEGWKAVSNDKEYCFMVDLDMGSIVYFMLE